ERRGARALPAPQHRAPSPAPHREADRRRSHRRRFTPRATPRDPRASSARAARVVIRRRVRDAQRTPTGVDQRVVWQEHWSDMEFVRLLLALIDIFLDERMYSLL